MGSWALSGCSSWTRLSTCLRCCSCSMWTRWSPSRLCWSCFGCPPCLFFDKFVDTPVAAQLQLVDKVVDFAACRSCCFSRCPSREDSPIPQLTIVEKTVEIPQLQYSLKMVDVPVLAGRAWFPVQVVWLRRVSHSCIVEKLVEIPESESASRLCGKLPCSALFLDKVFTVLQAVAACGE